MGASCDWASGLPPRRGVCRSGSLYRRASGEPVQGRRAVVHLGLALPGGLQLARGEHAAPEGVLVQRPPQDGLVHLLQLVQGERLRQELEAHRARETQGEIERRYRARMAAAAGSDPELLEIENDTTLPVSLPMALAIKESEAAPQVLRYLSTHRDEALRISRMNPIAAAREIGRIEAGASNAPPQQPRTISQAPEPVRPVGGTKGSIETDDERVPIDEFVRRRNEAQYGRRR